jgi:hypothetical protein
MSKGPGKIMAAILAKIESERASGHEVCFSARVVCQDCFGFELSERQPTRAELSSVIRAMHSICRTSNQYALAGGKGQTPLYLYDAADPVSETYMKMKLTRGKLIKPSRPMTMNNRGKLVPARAYVVTSVAENAVAAADPVFAKALVKTRSDRIAKTIDRATGMGIEAAAQMVDNLLRQEADRRSMKSGGRL